jgi:hypothetical protein
LRYGSIGSWLSNPGRGSKSMQERIGIIDLGSNTTRLVVMGYTPHHSFRLLDEVRETVRLAEGVGDDGQLKPVPMARGVEARVARLLPGPATGAAARRTR